MQLELGRTMPSTERPFHVGWTAWQPFNRLLAEHGALRKSNAKDVHVHVDRSRKAARVELSGRIDRQTVLALQRQLERLVERIPTVSVDVSKVSRLDMRRLATVQMLCSALERKGGTATLIGVPADLQLVALEARLQYLINFE